MLSPRLAALRYRDNALDLIAVDHPRHQAAGRYLLGQRQFAGRPKVKELRRRWATLCLEHAERGALLPRAYSLANDEASLRIRSISPRCAARPRPTVHRPVGGYRPWLAFREAAANRLCRYAGSLRRTSAAQVGRQAKPTPIRLEPFQRHAASFARPARRSARARAAPARRTLRGHIKAAMRSTVEAGCWSRF